MTKKLIGEDFFIADYIFYSVADPKPFDSDPDPTFRLDSDSRSRIWTQSCNVKVTKHV